jgi:putative pyruvate formate lyase activating enzyme
MDLITPYRECHLCPRSCGTNRLSNSKEIRPGFCGETDRLKVAYIGPHFGEEPPISGKNGSGTVFFTGCHLKCSFCQNYQISHEGLGERTSTDKLFKKIEQMMRLHHVHNINFVTPDHFFPHVFQIVSLLRQDGHNLPLVYNLSGYQSVEILKAAENYADIYLPDFKYSDPHLAARLSKCRDYPEAALTAIEEMIRQKGFLDISGTKSSIAKKGVLVRHLILPGKIDNSINALTSLYVEFGPELPVSIMSQYHPVIHHTDTDLNRTILPEEFEEVYSHAMDLGFENLFVQFPKSAGKRDHDTPLFLPDFRQKEPFGYSAVKALLPNKLQQNDTD